MERNIILEFVHAINEHNLDTIAGLLTEDHIFTDAHNNSIKGKDKMVPAWKAYFEWFPDYTIELSDIIQAGACYAAFGYTKGTYHNMHDENKSNHFHLPTAWKISLENDKVKMWQVYADTKVPFDIMQRNSKQRTQ